MRLLRRHLLPVLVSFGISAAAAADRPNILWITSEDNAAHWLGCYGNAEASTPRLDALAAGGLMFTHAYANGPVCAVARSTILNGAYAVTQGTQHMRSRHPIPPDFVAHATHLRRLGYYCTNNSKTDYNFRGNDAALWDDCSGKAHYRKRPDGKPFFAIFNLMITHESQLFPKSVADNRKLGIIPETPRLDPAKLTVPPHLPDLPEVRNDIAIYHDCMSAMDHQVGALLDELAAAGLAEDTIVFYYSDHGGAMARGKRYLQDTGTRVPLIIHIPEKWRHLSPFQPGSKVDEPVSFVDLAPTLLSLCGQPTPAAMQGRAFLGGHRRAPAPDDMVLLYADRFDELEGMRRGLTDGRWRYIRCFSPQLPGAPYSVYPLGQPSWRAWREAAQNGRLSALHSAMWRTPQPVEMLFDTSSDPWEIDNLAGNAAHAGRLAAMRARLRATMAATRDTSLVPEPMWPALAGDKTIHEYVRSAAFDLETTLDLAFAASSSDPANLPAFIKALGSKDPVLRYWAATGCLILAKDAAPAIDALTKCMEDADQLVRIVAAEALIAAGRPDSGKAALIAALDLPMPAECREWLINALKRAGLQDRIPASSP
jgi:arylsulfatase A-like enzyme